MTEQQSNLDLKEVVRQQSYQKGMRRFTFATPRSKSFSSDLGPLIPSAEQREALKRKALNATSQGYVTKWQYLRDIEDLRKENKERLEKMKTDTNMLLNNKVKEKEGKIVDLNAELKKLKEEIEMKDLQLQV